MKKSTATLLFTLPAASRSSIVTWVEYRVANPSGPKVAPWVSQVYRPVLLMLAALGAKGDPGWQKREGAQAESGSTELASAAVEKRKCRGSPLGSAPGTRNEHRALMGHRTMGGKAVTGELLPVPTVTTVSTR